MIGVQVAITGYQFLAKYQLLRSKEMALCWLPIETIMWLFATLRMLATVPNLNLLSALVIASCVNCTDPISLRPLRMVLSTAMSVVRKLRKITSSVAGADDGFGFLFLMLPVYSTRYANGDDSSGGHGTVARVGRLSGGVGVAIGN